MTLSSKVDLASTPNLTLALTLNLDLNPGPPLLTRNPLLHNQSISPRPHPHLTQTLRLAITLALALLSKVTPEIRAMSM